MELLNKIPRWAMTSAFICTLSLAGMTTHFIATDTYGRLQTNTDAIQAARKESDEKILAAKKLAWEAQAAATKVASDLKSSSDTTNLILAGVSAQIQEIKKNNDIFKTEYREDQKELRELISRPR